MIEGRREDTVLDASRKIGPAQRKALLSSFIGWMFDGFETSTLILVGNAAAASLLSNPNPDDIRLAVGTALGATLMGWAIGGVVGSLGADRVGRKPMLMISIAGYCAFTGLTALSPSVTALVVARFLTGLFLGSEWSTGTALVAETWPASSRARALGVMQSGYGFGFLLAAGIWLILQSLTGPEGWRWMFCSGVLPAFVLIYIRRSVPESELWIAAATERKRTRDTGGKPEGVIHLLRDPSVRGRAAGAFLMAAVTVSVFYAISALSGPYIGAIAAGQGLEASRWAGISALVYNGGAIVGYVSAGFLVDRLGRKPYMYLAFTGAVGAGALTFLAPPTLAISLACVFVLGVFTLGVFSWMPIYLPELFPTSIRATAMGCVFSCARMVAFPLPILTALLYSSLGGYQSTVLALTLLYTIAILVLRFMPETGTAALPT